MTSFKNLRLLAALLALLMLLSSCGRTGEGDTPDSPAPDGISGSGGFEEAEPYLALNTPDYKSRTVAEFDADFEPFQHIYSGYGREHPHMGFMQSLFYAKLELVSAENDEPPSVGFTASADNWAFHYVIYWDIADRSHTTVGERDRLIAACEEMVQGTFEGFTESELSADSAIGNLQASLDRVAEALSSDWGEVRLLAEELVKYD